MSSSGQTVPSDPGGGQPVNSLTVVVLLLIPCVVILLLLNCFFLLYKLLRTRTRTRDHPQPYTQVQELLLQHRRASSSQSDHPVTSSRASFRDHCGVPLLLTSVRAPSTIRATYSSAPRLTLRPEPPPGPGSPSSSSSSTKAGWCRSSFALLRSTDSEAEVRVNLVPPNTPMNPLSLHQEAGHVDLINNSSDYEVLPDVCVHVCDDAEGALEHTDPLSLTSWINTSTAGPGLDSDFGASAGVSLRILSADSDALLTSALEWDYYDPCYVKQNHLPKQQHHRPALHTKHYWV